MMDSRNFESDKSELLLQVIELESSDSFNSPEDSIVDNDGFKNTGAFKKGVDFVAEQKAQAMKKIRQETLSLADFFGTSLNNIANKPDKFEIELAFSISAKGNLCIVNAESAATVKVKMQWGK